MRRVAIVELDANLLGFAIRGRRDAAITSDWPEDAMVVGGEFNVDRGVVRLLVESAGFAEVPIGNQIPQWRPTFTAYAVEPGALAVMDLIDKMHREGANDVAERA